MTEANYDEVICPNCVTQFRAIPVNVQNELRVLTAERGEWKARCEFSFEQRNKLNAQLETLRYEVDAIPAIKAERDEYAACADTMAAAHKVERDALKDAARLALDALIEIKENGLSWDAEYDKAIAALKAVL